MPADPRRVIPYVQAENVGAPTSVVPRLPRSTWLLGVLLLWFAVQWFLLKVEPVPQPGTIEYWPPNRVRDGMLASAMGLTFWSMAVASCAAALSTASHVRWLKGGWRAVLVSGGLIVTVGYGLRILPDLFGVGVATDSPMSATNLWSSGWAWFLAVHGSSPRQTAGLSLAAAGLDFIIIAMVARWLQSAMPRGRASESQRRAPIAESVFLMAWVCVMCTIVTVALSMAMDLPTFGVTWLMAAWPLWLCSLVWAWALVRLPRSSTAGRFAIALGWSLGLAAVSAAAGAAWLGANGLLPTPSTSSALAGLAPSTTLTVLSVATALGIFLAWVAPKLTAWLQVHTTIALAATLSANLADAVATGLALNAGRASELNPLVSTFGLGLKVLVGTALVIVLWRVKPSFLWVPLLVLVAVNVYHLAGTIPV